MKYWVESIVGSAWYWLDHRPIDSQMNLNSFSSLLCLPIQEETFLCHRFTRFVMKYNLMSKDNLIVPILEEEVQNAASAESDA